MEKQYLTVYGLSWQPCLCLAHYRHVIAYDNLLWYTPMRCDYTKRFTARVYIRKCKQPRLEGAVVLYCLFNHGALFNRHNAVYVACALCKFHCKYWICSHVSKHDTNAMRTKAGTLFDEALPGYHVRVGGGSFITLLELSCGIGQCFVSRVLLVLRRVLLQCIYSNSCNIRNYVRITHSLPGEIQIRSQNEADLNL